MLPFALGVSNLSKSYVLLDARTAAVEELMAKWDVLLRGCAGIGSSSPWNQKVALDAVMGVLGVLAII